MQRFIIWKKGATWYAQNEQEQRCYSSRKAGVMQWIYRQTGNENFILIPCQRKVSFRVLQNKENETLVYLPEWKEKVWIPTEWLPIIKTYGKLVA